jgi:acyl-coenzyme A synthetase/AMP-(fatty) acid ligase
LPFNPEMQIVTGGASLPWRVAEQAMARLTPQLISGLGSTEAGAIACTRVQGPRDQLTHILDPSRQVEVVDDEDKPVAPGMSGHIRVRLRPGDAEGYLGDEAATRAFFRDGFFYPGDLGFIDGSGRLALEGRASEVLNIGGDKISALPFEQSIQANTGASGACMFAETEGGGEPSLHVVLELDRPLTEAEQQFMGSLTSGWEAHIHYIRTLPRNDMGKINRSELRRSLFRDRAAEGRA